MDTTAEAAVSTRYLMRFIGLSIATAVLTVSTKGIAAWLTGSVGLLSDALESVVNLVAALVALWALAVSAKPADHNHDYGHGKAEYMSSLVEGALIFVAASVIVISAIRRFITPQPVEELGWGLVLSVIASALNLAVGLVLIRAGRKYRSITLEADGHHLLTDVWTTVGVIAGLGLLVLTDWYWIDPLIAFLVGVNILVTGAKLVRRSAVGLLDASLPDSDVQVIRGAVSSVTDDARVMLKDLRTRESGRQRFAEATVMVPGHWTVARGHDLADAIEHAVAAALPETTTVVHIEPGPSQLPPDGATDASPGETGDAR